MTPSSDDILGGPSLLDPLLKLERAVQHMDELQPKIQSYIETNPYGPPKEHAEGEWTVLCFDEVSSYPDHMWGVQVGEVLHDLRSALDNLVWQLVRVNGQEPGDHNQFPIYTDPDRPPGPPRIKALRGKLPKDATRIDEMLFGVHADHVATIKGLQPYIGLDEHRNWKIALGSLADLNNIDKHKVIHPAVGMSQRGDSGQVTHESGPPPSGVQVEYRLGPIYPGAEILRWRVLGGTKETKVTMEGQVPFDIAFGHPNLTLAHLDWMHEQVTEVVCLFEDALPPLPDWS